MNSLLLPSSSSFSNCCAACSTPKKLQIRQVGVDIAFCHHCVHLSISPTSQTNATSHGQSSSRFETAGDFIAFQSTFKILAFPLAHQQIYGIHETHHIFERIGAAPIFAIRALWMGTKKDPMTMAPLHLQL